VLTDVKLDVRDLHSRPETDQPPDCEGTINGQWCAIEDTETCASTDHEALYQGKARAQR
jgi:hypothetical protein